MAENIAVRHFWLKVVRHFLELIIVDTLRKEPLNGNQLKQKVHDKYAVDLSSDAIYDRLRNLQKQGLIEPAKTESEGKTYTATKQGVDLLNKLAAYREETTTFLKALLTSKEET